MNHGILPFGGCQGSAKLILLTTKQKKNDKITGTTWINHKHQNNRFSSWNNAICYHISERYYTTSPYNNITYLYIEHGIWICNISSIYIQSISSNDIAPCLHVIYSTMKHLSPGELSRRGTIQQQGLPIDFYVEHRSYHVFLKI